MLGVLEKCESWNVVSPGIFAGNPISQHFHISKNCVVSFQV